MASLDSTYTISGNQGWPPPTKPEAPFGPTLIELVRSCPLRACFVASDGYETRMDPAGRIGRVFHRTMENLVRSSRGEHDEESLAEQTREVFRAQLAAEADEAWKRPRERSLHNDTRRAFMAEEAAVAEAMRLARDPLLALRQRGPDISSSIHLIGPAQAHLEAPLENGVAAEVVVHSADGSFSGRIDRVEMTNGKATIIDFKSAVRDDLPERYRRQVQMYAVLFAETFNDWPERGLVRYPLTERSFEVAIKRSECKAVVGEARKLVERLGHGKPMELALPGDTCKVCDFRPWCRAFWRSQDESNSDRQALEKANLGFEARVRALNIVDNYVSMALDWATRKVKLVAPKERLPHLSAAKPGDMVRVLDARLEGLRLSPRAIVTDYTEVFLVKQAK